MPLVSAIIPLYNYEKYIEGSINSILNQTFGDYEIIVVDDGSTDCSARVVKNYLNQVRYFYQDNRGHSAARNNGISQARGKYIAFLDADDLWMPEKLEKQMKMFVESPDMSMIGCGYHLIDSDGGLINTVSGFEYKDQKIILDNWKIHNVPCGSASGMVVRRECFDSVGMFDENLGSAEDRDMWFRIAKRFRVSVLQEPLAKIRSHLNNLHKNVPKVIHNQKIFIQKHLSQEGWHIKRKAYGYVYLDAAHEYYDQGRKREALVSAFHSLQYFPLKICETDDRWKLIIKSLLHVFRRVS